MKMGLDQIIGLVDGFMTLGVLVYFVIQNRKDIREIKSEYNAAKDKHLADMKNHNEEYGALLEKTLVSLNENRQFIENHIIGLEQRLSTKIDTIKHENRNSK